MPKNDGAELAGDTTSQTFASWLIVLRADGVVDSVEGGAPRAWVGQALVDAPGVAPLVRRAAAELVEAPPTSNVRRRVVRCAVGRKKVDVEVLLVEAVPLRRARTRVDELVMRTLDLFASQARSSNIDLTIDQAPDVPPVIVVDVEKIAWVLSTLVANGLRYATAHVGVHVRWDGPTSGLLIEVTDDGPGMAGHTVQWLFERNPTNGQSTGLALVVVRDVIAAHRGTLAVESRPGRGTTFTLRIPRVDEKR
jgi:light-regulated signal transduction histidine kinase (bacteriophytochrome)